MCAVWPSAFAGVVIVLGGLVMLADLGFQRLGQHVPGCALFAGLLRALTEAGQGLLLAAPLLGWLGIALLLVL